MATLVRLQVGAPYPGRIPTDEGLDLNFLSSGLELRVFLSEVEPDEAMAYRRGEAQVALYDHDELLILCLRVGR